MSNRNVGNEAGRNVPNRPGLGDVEGREIYRSRPYVPSLVLVPLPGVGTLELPREVFEQYLRVDVPPRVERVGSADIVDADKLEERTGIPASWWMTQARERRIPFHKFGRYVRFDFAEVTRCDAYKRRAVDGAGHEIQTGGASD